MNAQTPISMAFSSLNRMKEIEEQILNFKNRKLLLKELED
jgi:hypothetical protein